ncbi:hypothetical protein [Fodinicurvata sp. EGI_FJ10296]|uniref:hypothetical protein n=1 Tax=Fodinicurvata sp. EGI_FJ10296 TaxID=3231908 RepID=UPI003454E0F4
MTDAETRQCPLSGRRFATIVLLGPLAGSLVYALVAVTLEPDPLGFGDRLGFGLLIVFLGYGMGLVPDLVGAIVWWLIPRPRTCLSRTGLAALVGALAGVGGIAVLVPLMDLSWPDPGILALIALCGAIALVVTAIPRSGERQG